MPVKKLISSGSPFEERSGYSRAVVFGDSVYVAGTIGMDFATLRMPEGAAAQAEKALDIIEAALKQVPARMEDIVRVRVYVADREDVREVGPVLKKRLGHVRPANTIVCTPLAVPGVRVEIEVEARIGAGL